MSDPEDNLISIWDVDSESWFKKACNIANRNFLRDEWEKYIGENYPYKKTCEDRPKDTLGAIKLAAEARQLLKDGKTKSHRQI
ncbi:hypothetical protein [Candidatus Albibeggiatoa sp. nov. BB20]|uniref:hypothetical protein n=1 Tax=Candidatus Albibeggiatoa sp. nov. BB20 TaxID=3162723 RepID=UPI003365878B